MGASEDVVRGVGQGIVRVNHLQRVHHLQDHLAHHVHHLQPFSTGRLEAADICELKCILRTVHFNEGQGQQNRQREREEGSTIKCGVRGKARQSERDPSKRTRYAALRTEKISTPVRRGGACCHNVVCACVRWDKMAVRDAFTELGGVTRMVQSGT